jgi:acetate kinase
MHEPILVINAGSSSIKFSVFETGADRSLSPAAHGEVERMPSRLSATN